jgi:hypothetical protein
VLVDDLRGQRAQCFQAVWRAYISTPLASARLVAAGLVGAVEQRTHLRIVAHEHLVEMRDQRFAARFQQGTVDLTMASWASVSMLGLSVVEWICRWSGLPSTITKAVPCW